jgi:hypothetical protein
MFKYYNDWRERGRGRKVERERERGVRERKRDKPLYRWDKVSSSYHTNLHALSTGPLEMTIQTKMCSLIKM